MALIRAKLKQLRDADVRYISLVDRAATRIPFRVLKRDAKENMMGIDLTKVFKSDDTAKPYVSALVVFAQKDDAAGKLVAEAIEKHGFKTDRVQKSDAGETLVYAQVDQPKDFSIVRLSDQMLVNVANLKTPSGWVGEMVKEHGFFPDLQTATDALYGQLVEVAKSDTPQEDAIGVLTSFSEYLNQVIVLPTNAFKLDEAIAEIAKKCSCEDKKDDKKDSVSKESDEEKAKRFKDHPPAEMEPKDEDDDQKCPPDAVNKGDKKPEEKSAVKGEVTDSAAILAAIKDLTTKVEAVATEQTAQKKVLDDVVQKADTLSTKLATTVVAPPADEDRPAGSTRMRTQKQDDDPRTGNFDTAFLRRRK